MSKMKMLLFTSVIAPAIFLAGCFGEEDKVIEPDKEPSEVATTVDKTKQKLTIAHITEWYKEDLSLTDYQEMLAEYGYEKPYQDILLADGDAMTKKGLIYKVEDGFSMLEYDAETESVVAITGFQDESEFVLQGMKTEAFAKENQLALETDEAKKAELQAEIDKMWTDIGAMEQ